MAAKKAHGEVGAMGMVEAALAPLDEGERARVLRWAADRYGVKIAPATPAANSSSPSANINRTLDVVVPESLEDAGDLYAQASPTTDAEKALVIAYWVQESTGTGDFDSQTVNTKLKHLGHGIGNITRAVEDLKKLRPQLVIQLEKSGKTRQARKRYKVTAAGKARVKEMLSGDEG